MADAQNGRIEDAIKRMMVERLFLKVQPQEISDEGDLSEELGIDSVSVFEIVVGLEDLYGISVEDEEFSMEHFASVKRIADFVRRKQGAQ